MEAKRFAFTPFSKATPFEAWIESEGIPVVREFVVQDLRSVETGPLGANGRKGSMVGIRLGE